MHMALLCAHPPVLLTSTTNLVEIPGRETDTLSHFADLLGEEKPYFLIQPTWHFADAVKNDSYRAILTRALARHGPGHVIILTAEPEDAAVAHALGLDWWNVHHNALVDETVFTPTAVPKHFDALYNARFDAFKNHHLARLVDNLALVFSPAHSAEDAARVERMLTYAHFINGGATDPARYRRLSPRETAEAIGKARVGLCLSFVEGAMYASIEYLLCGVPVVSVANKGGRDAFADPAWWRVCEPTPEAVAQAVREMAARRIDPQMIANGVRRRIAPHRLRLVDLMRRIQQQAGVAPNWSTDWSFLRGEAFGGMLHQSFVDVMAALGRLRQGDRAGDGGLPQGNLKISAASSPP
ncbi:hypothetical protein M2323_000437 [Rhodoblastus acidophilus]|uniref:hypothetical protein n=1 Tax=Rhodoblastus acidophilus TaxID=1074 RepID=UPI0022253ADB|nr:hypothetical protein [Rhodoblastus acidophilus]MCW2282676.1 hypothetical protein [Rhodoblastus acidophilus]MCW2331537.1 hypothetical protein [Rhodoblastus acidophilus]